MDTIALIYNEMQSLSDPLRACFSRKLLRVENDSERLIWGCRLPVLRKIYRNYATYLSSKEVLILLQSNCHEARQLALIAMVDKFKAEPQAITKLYLNNIAYIDNWDLVDISAPKIIGEFYEPTDEIFKQLARDPNIWANRIAMVSTLSFIKNKQFTLTLQLAQLFIGHKSHFLHKASGWMLREVGKRNTKVLLQFLAKHATVMPKIMLRYACERLSKEQKSTIYG
ncbi:MAG: DNA alkylation repair protein [Puniceicoccales bacterium]|jgi:3-methyladenine DNA glycosylase AlkD|nr:DNA alkylation repair protein [Puniceicoccales bacterium]